MDWQLHQSEVYVATIIYVPNVPHPADS